MEYEQRNNDFSKMKNLDVDYIEVLWHFRRHWKAFEISAGFINALAWFIFTIPVMQMAWILSLGGKRGLWMHATIVALAMFGSFTEFIARLFYVGISGVTEWITKAVNLDDWNSAGDGMGWRTLETCHMVTSGMVIWVDAFEWLCLCGILTLIYISARGLMSSPAYSAHLDLGRCWTHLGLFIGLLSLVDFVANVLRFESFGSFSTIAMIISILNRLLLLPLWLFCFGRALAVAASSSEISGMVDDSNANYAGSSDQSLSHPIITPITGTNGDSVGSQAGPMNS